MDSNLGIFGKRIALAKGQNGALVNKTLSIIVKCGFLNV